MKKKVFSVCLICSLVLTLISGCMFTNKGARSAAAPAKENANASETKTVRLALSGSAHIFNAIAEEQGYLKDEGITVEYVTCESAEGAFSSLAAGKVDVLSNYGTNLPLQYVASGSDITMFAGYMLTGSMPVIAKAGTKWNGVQDLIGKTVACEPSVYAISGALLDMGYDPLKEVTWLNLDNHADRIAAVRSREADYAVLGTEMMYSVLQMEDINILTYCGEVMPNYSCCRVEANTAWLNKNPNTTKGLLRAWIRAQEYYEGHKDETITTVAGSISATKEYVAAYINNDDYRLNIDPYQSAIHRAWGYMGRLGLLDEKAASINMYDHINTKLYKEALDQCVERYYKENPEFYDTMKATFEANNE